MKLEVINFSVGSVPHPSIFYMEDSRAFYMGELHNNMTSSRTITKKMVSFTKFETVGTKNIFYVVIFFVD